MQPLRSSVVEYRLIGYAHIALGVIIAVIAATHHGLGVVIADWALGAAFFGGFMYLRVYRRSLRDALQGARPAPNSARYEVVGMTYRRVGLWALTTSVPVLLFALLLRNPNVVAGIPSGNGAAILVLSQQITRWQREHNVQVMREPRYRWRRSEQHRGRGIMDPRDFYFAQHAP
jgi:hypothetical protein